jgi:hypothetical protein
MIDDECGAVGGMRIGRGNRSIRRKLAPMPLCLPQIPRDLGSNRDHRGVKLIPNRLSYDTAQPSELSDIFSLVNKAFLLSDFFIGKVGSGLGLGLISYILLMDINLFRLMCCVYTECSRRKGQYSWRT